MLFPAPASDCQINTLIGLEGRTIGAAYLFPIKLQDHVSRNESRGHRARVGLNARDLYIAVSRYGILKPQVDIFIAVFSSL